MSDLATVMAVHEVSLRKLLEGWGPVVCKGQILQLEKESDDGDVFGVETVSLQDLVPGAEGYLEAHPDGSDRGGYVPHIYLGEKWVYWDEMENKWCR